MPVHEGKPGTGASTPRTLQGLATKSSLGHKTRVSDLHFSASLDQRPNSWQEAKKYHGYEGHPPCGGLKLVNLNENLQWQFSRPLSFHRKVAAFSGWSCFSTKACPLSRFLLSKVLPGRASLVSKFAHISFANSGYFPLPDFTVYSFSQSNATRHEPRW